MSLHPLAVVYKQIMSDFCLPHELMAREPHFLSSINNWHLLVNKAAQSLAISQFQQRAKLGDIILFFPCENAELGKDRKKKMR